MDCETFSRFLNPWLEHQVDGRIRASLQAHSMLCRECSEAKKIRESLRVIMRASLIQAAKTPL